MNLITARYLQDQIKGVYHVPGPRVPAELPRDDAAAVIVQDRAEIEPVASQNLEIGKFGQSKLVDGLCLMPKLIRGFPHDERRAGIHAMCVERATHCGFRYKEPFSVCERHRQLAGRQLCLLQCEADDFALIIPS